MTSAIARPLLHALCAIAAICTPATSFAADPVFKCTANGKTSYSNEPCIGAVEVDTTPTRGMDKWTGQPRQGKDVQREKHRESIAEAFKPLTGMNAQQLEQHQRRMRLPQEVQGECKRLDVELANSKQSEPQDKHKLFEARKKFKLLSC